MSGLQSIDVALFRWVNQSMVNPLFDVLMPFLSGNRFFLPAVVVLAVYLIYRHRSYGVLFIVTIALAISITDAYVVHSLKDLVARPRPFVDLPDTRLLVGKGLHFGFPSSHSANWFCAAAVTFFFYRNAVWPVLVLAVTVSFSRLYCGVHYPSDVAFGALVGAGCGFAMVWTLETLWRTAGKRWIPLWWRQRKSLLQRQPRNHNGSRPTSQPPAMISLADANRYWLRLGYLLIMVLLLVRWFYVASDTIELSEDEAYQWVWSKYPALSYFSKPPLIAYTQWLGTTLWGDTILGVRFFSPVISAILSLLILRFFHRIASARLGWWVVLMATTAPMLAVGSTLMTIDPLSVLFWTAAMITGWRAVNENSTRAWMWTGLWMGLGFLSKYTALFQWLCWIVLFALSAKARRQLKRPGPYLALGINLLLTIPVLIWNYQHGWITVTHVATDGGFYRVWKPTLRYFLDFAGSEFGLLNPVFFVGLIGAAVLFWRERSRDERKVYLFCMGAPLFLAYGLFTFRSRVLPNWIAPSVIPLFCLAALYWHGRYLTGSTWVRRAFIAGLSLGAVAVVVLHDTNLIGKFTGYTLPPKIDPLRRVRGWEETGRVVEEVRQKLLKEGKPVFIIGDHYGITGQLAFNIPEARTNVLSNPLVFFRSTKVPENQFYFLPGYKERKGQNAIFVRVGDKPATAPESLGREFSTITDLGQVEIKYRGRVMRKLQLYECRNLL